MKQHSLRRRVTVISAIVVTLPIGALFIFTCIFLRDAAARPENAFTKHNTLCVVGAVAGREDIPPRPGLPPVDPTDFGDDDVGEVEIASSYPNPAKTWGMSCIAPSGPVGETRGIEVRSKKLDAHVSERATLLDEKMACTAWYHSYSVVPELTLWPFADPGETRYSFITDTGERRTVVQGVGSESEAAAAAQRSLNTQIILAGSAAVLLIGLFTTVVSLATGRVLRPVEAIRRSMADITEQDLTCRVPTPRADNEIARLATTVNATLDRLETAVEENRRFVADASHELRSPITALRAELEIASAHPGQADWPAVVDAALADTQRLQTLATDLLLLARLDHAPSAVTATVDLTDVIRDHTAHRRTRHTLAVAVPDRPVLVRGSKALLDRLLGNLLDNAERHATTTITVNLTTGTDQAVLDVADDGPGIPPEDRERVFDRFTRLDDARTRATGGTGLGLPIARRIATTHNGTLHATDHHGARFTVTLPLAAPESAGSR
ncbi:HAMP domain-containing sensor histidine kinase [Saccharothrix sp. NPDC042600]|uniref:sensor histidine kinase n=1 Tax=Saccharothrix TaxID=2071 RepID=UPI0033FE3EF7|nr:hypothetical protein GCM10017745_48430 [Saccharothrix mutabilis subsp. capreolus]